MNRNGFKDGEATAGSSLITAISFRIKGKTLQDFSLTLLCNFVILVAGSIGGILSARLLGPSGRGELAAVIVWITIFGVIAAIGLPQALTYYTARNPARVGNIFYSSMLLLLIQSVAIIAVGWILITEILGRYQPIVVSLAHIYLFSIPLSNLLNYLSTIAQGLKHFLLYNSLRVLSAMSYVIALFLAAFLGINEANGLLMMMLGFQAIAAICGLMFFTVKVRPKGNCDRRLSGDLLSYGLKSYWGNLSWLANGRLDQFVMSAFISLDQLGLYAVAVSYAMITFQLSSSFAMVLFPSVASEMGKSGLRKVQKAMKLNLLTSVSGVMFLALAAPFIMPRLFGSDFDGSIKPAIILLAGTVLLGTNYVLSDGLRGLGRPFLPSMGEVFGLFTTIVGLVLILPRYGIVGAAWVSVFSYGCVLIFLLNAIKNKIN